MVVSRSLCSSSEVSFTLSVTERDGGGLNIAHKCFHPVELMLLAVGFFLACTNINSAHTYTHSAQTHMHIHT